MLTLNAHFDGKTIVLDEPFSLPLPLGARLKVMVEPVDETLLVTPEPRPVTGPKAGSAKGKVTIAPDFDAPLEDFAEYTK